MDQQTTALQATLRPVLNAMDTERAQWRATPRSRRTDRPPGMRNLLLGRADLARLVHDACHTYRGVQPVADALGCSRQALRDVFIHHRLPAPVRPRRSPRNSR
jgi:hypothetical protein